MLDFMRRNARSWGIKLALGAIVLTFVFFMGGGGQIGQGLKPLVKVGEIEISRTEYDMAQRRNENYFRQQFQGPQAEMMLKSINIPKMTLDKLVDGAVLRAEAERLGLEVTEDAIRDQLRRVPSFQSNGAFSPGLYRETLRSQGLSPGMFEQTVRQELLEAQMADVIRRGSHVSEEDAWRDYQRENRKMTLSYIAVDSEPFKSDVAIDDAALTKFYEGKQESYRRPPTVKVRYAPYKVADIAGKVEVSEVDLNEYYELNKNSEFQNDEQVGARHILKKIGGDAGEDAKNAARAAIEAIARRIAAGEVFEEVARAESDDTGSAMKGGDLGLFSRGKMVPAFEEAAFALEPGKTSEIVESDFGFHIIQVYEKKPAGVAPFDEVKDRIRTTLATQMALDRAFDDSAEDAAKIADGAKFEEVVAARGLEIDETTPFAQGDTIPGIGPAPNFADAAFSLVNPGDVSQPVKVGTDYYLLSLAERKESEIPPLVAIRSEIEEDYREDQALDLARKRADEMLAAARSGTSLSDLAQQHNLEVKKAEDVSASSNFVKDVGTVQGLSEVAFGAASDGQPLARSFVSGSKAYIFVRDSVTEPAREDFDASKESYLERLETAREQEALQEFVASLKRTEEISYDLAQIRPLLGDAAPAVD